MQTVDRDTLNSWLGEPDLFLMDVRSDAAWRGSIAKIEFAHRFEVEKLGKMTMDLPKRKKLVLYCEDGETNCPVVARELERMGFNNLYVLEGGFQAWRGKEYLTVPKELKEHRILEKRA